MTIRRRGPRRSFRVDLDVLNAALSASSWRRYWGDDKAAAAAWAALSDRVRGNGPELERYTDLPDPYDAPDPRDDA